MRSRLLRTVTLATLASSLAPLPWLALEPSGQRASAQSTSVSDLLAEVETMRRSRPSPAVTDGVLDSIQYHLETARKIARAQPQARQWTERAARYVDEAKRGRNPFHGARGEITSRGYRSRVSTTIQGYGVYLPRNFDPSRRYPLVAILHGGSSNHNLFLGVVMGNNMRWTDYPQHLYDMYRAHWDADWIIVTPEGFGQVMWRWMGERDVLDVIEDAKREYPIDEERVVLNGISNGGVGTWNIGLRHAWRFSAVVPMAGAPGWRQYSGGPRVPYEDPLLRAQSGIDLSENAINTHLRYFHGTADPGPMRPQYVRTFTETIRPTGVPFREVWFEAGHDILYMTHKRGKMLRDLESIRRNRRPTEVRLVTGDYRAARQHWLEVGRIDDYPVRARLRARVASPGNVEIEVRNASVLALHRDDVPFGADQTSVTIEGQRAYSGAVSSLPTVAWFHRTAGSWRLGYPVPARDSDVKRPGLSGPITDAYHDRMVHVYGTQDAAATDALQRAARTGARGWPLWLWAVNQEVVADTAVTEAMMRDATLVLYGTPGSNSVLERMRERLPIRVEAGAVVVGAERFDRPDVGTRFIAPNPLAPTRYVIVQAGLSTGAVQAGHRLPDFVPDYVVYDGSSTRTRPRLVVSSRRPLAAGFFDGRWSISRPAGTGDDAPTPGSGAAGVPSGAGTDATAVHAKTRRRRHLRPPPRRPEDADDPAVAEAMRAAPPRPPLPPQYTGRDGAWTQAREIRRRVPTFLNFRAAIGYGTWRVDESAVWRIRRARECRQSARAAGVRFVMHRATDDGPTDVRPTPAPLYLSSSPIHGIRFSQYLGRILISCELASRLPRMAEILAPLDVDAVMVASSYRDQPRSSFHTFGMALDIARFRVRTPLTGPDGRTSRLLTVETDFVVTPNQRTCDPAFLRPDSLHGTNERGRRLLQIACALHDSGIFASVLTPNYNEGHRDHFHLDVRPDDPRLFIR